MALTRERLAPTAIGLGVARRMPLLAVLVGLCAAAVSVSGSWIPSLWGDEAASVLSAQRSIPSLFAMLGHVDAVHATYYLGLHFWIELFGASPFSVRFPSAVAIGVCVAGVVVLGTRLDSLTVGVVGGMICAVLPRVTGMGDEARSYAFTAAAATWLTIVFVSILRSERRRRRQWIVYGTVLAVGIYLFLYLALIAIAHLAVLLVSARTRPLIRPWARTMVVVVIVVSPLVVAGIFEHSQIGFLADRVTTDFYSLFVTVWFGMTSFAVVAWVAIIAAVAFFTRDVVARRARGLSNGDHSLSPTVVIGAWLFVPSVLLVSSRLLIPDFTARYLSMCAPAAALMMAIGVIRLAHRRVPLIALACAAIVAVAIPGWVQQRGPYAKNNSDWAVISADIRSLAQPGDAVAFDDSSRPSRRTRLAFDVYPAGFTGLDDITLKTPYSQNTTWFDSTYTVAEANRLGRLSGITRIWMVEYALPGHMDTAGISELESLGFTQRTSVRTHRSVIMGFTR
ncbi:glycosyltransferase family 39 protein [Lacisediminihabitans changchengi]|nr:glycosyltransferase family 39 protein [Lacisediminihabitans changchengi]